MDDLKEKKEESEDDLELSPRALLDDDVDNDDGVDEDEADAGEAA